MTQDSLRSKLAKEFRSAQIQAGIAKPMVGINAALLLRKLCDAPAPLEMVNDGRVRSAPPLNMGALVKVGLARFEPVRKAYEVTVSGRELDAVMQAKGLVTLAGEMERRIMSFGEEVEP